MNIDKAIKLLQEYYEKGQTLQYVRDPLAWALYQVWKIADSKARSSERYYDL